jgi:hypothetical protein
MPTFILCIQGLAADKSAGFCDAWWRHANGHYYFYTGMAQQRRSDAADVKGHGRRTCKVRPKIPASGFIVN